MPTMGLPKFFTLEGVGGLWKKCELVPTVNEGAKGGLCGIERGCVAIRWVRGVQINHW